MRLPYVMLAFSIAVGCSSKQEMAADEPSGKPLEWRWSKEKTTLAYCTKQYLLDYEVEKEIPKEYYSPISIRTKQDRKIIYSYKDGSDTTVFTRSKDILYVAEHSPIATGCKVVAVDLKTGKRLWETRLEGIGPTGHSQYSNDVNIEIDGELIIVFGSESHGRYIEQLDMQSGKTIANKKLEADYTTR